MWDNRIEDWQGGVNRKGESGSPFLGNELPFRVGRARQDPLKPDAACGGESNARWRAQEAALGWARPGSGCAWAGRRREASPQEGRKEVRSSVLLMAGEERGPARLALPSLPGAPRERLHLLPCVVRHDGAAAVRRYFTPAIRRPGEPDEESVSFRGRSLKGKEVLLPEGYMGLVLEEDDAALQERQVRVKSTFESLTVWNLERAPNSSDEILMSLHWPKIAEGIHASVADEE
ncbi:ribonuclease H2 subunit C isoform X2 [Zootoca vivipara]|uniref:ribonuclease H2 subunit C isoform X2 n=1 Tax=Zootoca vivipara TaxID=8524 RepID=UPI00293BEDE0|nr:ribonuclease H2 subunit C isoform X2 [Zootoca vivipara]